MIFSIAVEEARDVAELIVLAGAAIGALAVIWHKAIKPPILFARRVENAMCRVEHELGNNGGGTLRDHVDAIGRQQGEMFLREEARHEAFDARLSRLEQAIIPTAPKRSPRTKQEATK